MPRLLAPYLSPGGKSAWVSRLLGHFPEWTDFGEPYAGGAAVTWRLPSSGQRGVLNDTDENVVNLYQVLRQATDADLARLAGYPWVINAAGFAEAQAIPGTADPIDRAYRLIYLSRSSFHHRLKKLDRGRVDRVIGAARLLAGWRKRLENVEISGTDAIDVIEADDSPGRFWYLDPPWPEYFHRWDAWTVASFKRMVGVLDGLTDALWLWDENPKIAQQVELPERWSRAVISRRGYDQFRGQVVVRERLLMANYPLSTDAR